MLIRAVVAADEPALRGRLWALLERADVLPEDPGKRRQSLRALMGHNVDLLVIERTYAGGSLATALRRLKHDREAPGIVVVTDREDPDERADLLAAGCEAVLYLGLPDDSLHGALEAIVARRQEVASRLLTETQPFRPSLSDFASESASMKALLDMAGKVVSSDTSLLILGETGVGKEWLARAIHAQGNRAHGPFVAVNCAALPEPLLESELFGHEAGAFTGATRSRRGAFEMAHRGTIFLDEIGETPFHLQVKLLRVLQDHCIQRIGAEKAVSLDVRVMAASNRDLQEALKAKTFRRDLFYRLGVVTLTVPPLRERREDIATIAESYVRYFCQRMGRRIERVSEEAMAAILAYEWPGNVRELINVIERAVLLCSEGEIGPEHLPAGVAQMGVRDAAGKLALGADGSVALRLAEDWKRRPLSQLRRQLVDELEIEYLSALLEETEGHVGRTAAKAGLNVRSLYGKMRRHGLRKESFRERKRK